MRHQTRQQRKIEHSKDGVQPQNSKKESTIRNPVDGHRFERSLDRQNSGMSKTNQQKRTQPYSYTSKKKMKKVRRANQHHHKKDKQTDVTQKFDYIGVLVHIFF